MRLLPRVLFGVMVCLLVGDSARTDEIPEITAQDLPEIFQKIKEGDKTAGSSLEYLTPEDQDGVPFLIKALKDENPLVRQVAISGLGFIGYAATSAIPSLHSALDDVDEGVRSNAAWALKEIGTIEAVPALLDALSSRDRVTSENGVNGLVEIGEPAVYLIQGRLGQGIRPKEKERLNEVLAEIQVNQKKKEEMERELAQYEFLKSIRKSTAKGPMVGIVEDSTGCTMAEEGDNYYTHKIFSENSMVIDDQSMKFEYIGPRKIRFDVDKRVRYETHFDFYKSGPIVLMVEYTPIKSKSPFVRDFDVIVRVAHGKEVTVIVGKGECGC